MQKLISLIAILLSCQSQAIVHPVVYQPMAGTFSDEEALPPHLIPPSSTQDGLGNCFSSTGAAYLDMLNCKARRAKDSKFDCSTLDPKDSFSRLATGKFGRYMPTAADISKYPGIYSKEDGRNATNVIVNVISDGLSAPSQACASIEKSLINFQDTDDYLKASQELFRRLELRYEIKKCPECAVTMAGQDQRSEAEDLKYFTSQLKVSQEELLSAFAKDTYGEFLEKLLIPNCNNPAKRVMYDGPKNIEIVNFPEKNAPGKTNYSAVIKEITNSLKTKTPVILNNICTDEPFITEKGCSKPGANSDNKHTLIITGYRKICGKDGCRGSIRVYNSYGESWQQKYKWIDAEAIIDRTGYQPATLTYIKEGSGNTAQNKSKSSAANTGN